MIYYSLVKRIFGAVFIGYSNSDLYPNGLTLLRSFVIMWNKEEFDQCEQLVCGFLILIGFITVSQLFCVTVLNKQWEGWNSDAFCGKNLLSLLILKTLWNDKNNLTFTEICVIKTFLLFVFKDTCTLWTKNW